MGVLGLLEPMYLKEPQIAENFDLYYFKEPAWFQFFHFPIMHVLYKIDYVKTQNKQLYVMGFKSWEPCHVLQLLTGSLN
jgi:hypothetical protein